MSEPFFLNLGFVIDREGNKVAASMRTEQWGAETVHVVALGETKADGYWLSTLFRYVLRDGLSDFEVLRDDCPLVAHFIPAGEMRSLVRRIMGGEHKAGTAKVSIRLDAQLFLRDPESTLARLF
jgi:hypothetical protein